MISTTDYYIRAEYFYHSGTCYAPADGPLTDGYGERLEFASREEAEAYLTASTEFEEGMGCERSASGKYSFAGTYVCHHGEYARPVYTIRKVRITA